MGNLDLIAQILATFNIMIYRNNPFEMLRNLIGQKGKQKVTVVFPKKTLDATNG